MIFNAPEGDSISADLRGWMDGLLLNNQRTFTRLKHGESELVLFEGGFPSRCGR